MSRFEVVHTGHIAGMGPDHIKRTIPHRFEGGNGKAEKYSTDEPNEVAILMASPLATLIEEGTTDEASQEAVRPEAAPPAEPEAADEAPATEAKLHRGKIVAAMMKQNFNADLRGMAKKYGVKLGKGRTKDVVVEDLADAYIANPGLMQGAEAAAE